jgi:hypothetical protein
MAKPKRGNIMKEKTTETTRTTEVEPREDGTRHVTTRETETRETTRVEPERKPRIIEEITEIEEDD